MKIRILFICLIVSVLQAFGRDFSYTYKGQTLTYTVLDEEAKTVRTKAGGDSYSPGNNVSGELIIPSLAKDGDVEYTVTEIGSYAFSSCSGLIEVTIPESVTSIGDSAFSCCSDLTKAEFASIESLCSIEFGNSYSNPLYDAHHLYINGTEITELTIPESVTSIGSYAFNCCSDLTSVIIPESITAIGESTFAGCYSLTSVTIPNSVTSIGNRAFEDCYGLTSVTIPESVTSIGDCTFHYCIGLTDVIIPNSVTSIGNDAFSYCICLTSVTMGNSVTSIGKYAFEHCIGLTSLKIANVNDWARISFGSYDSNPLYYAHNLYVGEGTELVKNIVIEGKAPISDYAFYGATCLERVRIKDGADIGADAFDGCSNLTDICINSVNLPINAFRSSSKLKNIYVPLETPPTASDNVFSNYEGVNLYVPEGCVSKYENAETCWWRFLDVYASDFADIDTLFAPDYKDISSGIEGVEINPEGSLSGTRPNDIYNLQGVCLKQNATEDDVKSLAPGLYIIGGKKVVVK